MEELLDVKTIEAAVAGEKEAIQVVLEHYAPMIEEEATIEVKQPDGSVKRVVDEDLKQEIIVALLEAIPKFQMEEEE